MTSAGTAILPLYAFFERLRKNDFPLGVDDYERLLRALRLRFGLDVPAYRQLLETCRRHPDIPYPKDEILSLCRLMWLKPDQSRQLFEESFEETWESDFRHIATSQDRQTEGPPVTGETTNQQDRSNTQVPDAKADQQEEMPPASSASEDLPSEGLYLRITTSERLTSGDVGFDPMKSLDRESSKFLFTSNYFPLDRRKIYQNLKTFPAFQHLYNIHEADVDATIKATLEKGFLHKVVPRKVKVNASRMLVLVDHLGSMAAFDQLSDLLQEDIRKVLNPAGKKDDTTMQTYYFYNYPTTHLYTDKKHIGAVSFQKVLDRLKSRPVSIVLISDAGAAKGSYNSTRIEATRGLLKKLYLFTNRVVWLNPMPKQRWVDTSADPIADRVAMYEITEAGIKHAVDFLKGASTKAIKTA